MATPQTKAKVSKNSQNQTYQKEAEEANHNQDEAAKFGAKSKQAPIAGKKIASAQGT
ncbi:MAG: hypothetical protein H7328_10470 [Bdellovibrio sp.]|nr:hypothetical protein [Bdellovibrio sp.]